MKGENPLWLKHQANEQRKRETSLHEQKQTRKYKDEVRTLRAEVERLRVERNKYADSYRFFKDEWRKAMDDNERLMAERDAAVQRAADCIPTNWCDPLLTGPTKVIHGKVDCPDIEALLTAIRKRILNGGEDG